MDNLEKIISRLPIQGATTTGGTSAKAGHVPILNAAGLLDASFITGLVIGAAPATAITFNPAGTLLDVGSVNVQLAIVDLDSKKLGISGLLSEFAGSSATAFSNIKQYASTAASGVVELATTPEAESGASSTLVAPASANLATFLKKSGGAISGIVTSITPTVSDQVTTKAYVDNLVATSITSGLTSGAGNLVYVDIVNGVDGTGLRGRGDKPFLTPGAAKTAALSGDTIVVLPGSYTGNSLLKTGVNWFLHSGAKITHSGATTDAMFHDVSGAMVSNISGYGEFLSSGANKAIFNLTNSGSIINCTCMSVTTVSSVGLGVVAGTHTFRIGKLTATDSYFINLAGGTTSIYSESAREIFSSSASYGLNIAGGTNFVKIDSLLSDKSAISITGGSQTVIGTTYTSTGGDVITISGGNTVFHVNKLVHSNNATHLANLSGTCTARIVTSDLVSTATADSVIFVTGTAVALTLKDCEAIATSTTYSIKCSVAHTINIRGCLSASANTLNTTFAGGLFNLT